MKLRLSILLLAAALAAAPAAGQTIKSLGYNTTNGQVIYSGTNPLTFTNPLAFGDTTNTASIRSNLGLGETNYPTFLGLELGGGDEMQINGTSIDSISFGGQFNFEERQFSQDGATVFQWSTNSFTVTPAATFATNVTVGGTLTATGNVTLSGVNNTAPAQTADSEDSLMTRDLGDARYGPTLLAYKTSNTSRASTTNVEADPHLTFSNVPVGIYEVTLAVQVYDNSNHGIIWNIGGTATASSIGRALAIGDLSLAGNVLGAISGGILTGQSVAPWANSTRVARYYGLVNVTAAGSLSLQWAQNTSNTNALQFSAGSRMTLVKFP